MTVILIIGLVLAVAVLTFAVFYWGTLWAASRRTSRQRANAMVFVVFVFLVVLCVIGVAWGIFLLVVHHVAVR